MITGHTAVYAVLGRPVAHSRSPALFNAWFARDGVDAVYVALSPDTPDLAAWLRGSGLTGVNLTAPFKTAALPAFTRLTPEARRIGAVNTAWISTDGWTGHNTDVEGVRAVLDSHAWRGTRAAVLGAGGAARAAVDALLGGVRELTVAARDPSRAAWAAALGARVTAWERPDAELVVDATSGDGRASAALGFGPSLSLWFDLSYAREATGPARAVRAHGARFVDGSAMLEEAAAASYRAFRRRDGAPSG